MLCLLEAKDDQWCDHAEHDLNDKSKFQQRSKLQYSYSKSQLWEHPQLRSEVAGATQCRAHHTLECRSRQRWLNYVAVCTLQLSQGTWVLAADVAGI